MNSKELENRLIDFAVDVINFVKTNRNNYAGNHLSAQIIRSSTSVPLNYGEAQSAETKRDFVHKLQIVLKEIRETHVNLRIIRQAELNDKTDKLSSLIIENNELISIFVKKCGNSQKHQSLIVNQ